MGNKLGIYLDEKLRQQIEIKKGEYVKVSISKNGSTTEFISKFNYNIILRRFVINQLKLIPNNLIRISIKRIVNAKRPEDVFKNNKIDLLSLIPEKTFLGFKIFVDKFTKNNGKWLRIWYAYERGSGRQIELIRYVDIDSFGRLLGQLQAEGSKLSGRRKWCVEFSNKLLSEHEDFISSIMKLGISSKNIEFICNFNPNKFDSIETEAEVQELCKKYEISGIKIKPRNNPRIWKSYKTVIRNTILSETLLASIDKIRKLIIENKLDINFCLLTCNFVSKLLTGDGTLDINKREYDYPRVRINIVDQSINCLNDYSKILKKLGFKAKVKEEEICVKSSCSLENLLFLYKIDAFKNTGNWNKLLIVIGLLLRGRRLKTKLRFIDLFDKKFSTFDLREKYKITLRGANDWINSMLNSGYIEVFDNSQRPYLYKLTKKAVEEGKMIFRINNELQNIANEFKIQNLWKLLNKFKVKSNLSAEERAYSVSLYENN